MSSNVVARTDRFVLMLLSLSLATNVYLATLVLRPPSVEAKSTSPTAVGTTVTSLSGRDLDGRVTSITFRSDQRPTLLYAFTTACPWCKANLPNIRALAASQAKSLRIVGLALDGDPSAVTTYLRDFDLDLPSILIPDNDTMRELKLAGVPHTLLISKNGQVEKAWSGAYTGALLSELSELFAVQLPGLAQK